MNVDRDELIKTLGLLKPGIASKEFLEQSNHFIFNKEEILSYNDSISVACPFEIGVKCTVDASLFYKLIEKLDSESIDITVDGTTLIVECGSVKAELPTVIDSGIFGFVDKLGEEQNKLEWFEVPKDFLDAIELCSFSAANDATLGTATCVWIEDKDVLSTDKYRASWYQMEEGIGKNLYIEAVLITEILNFAVPVEFCMSKSWAHFQLADGIVFSIRLVQPEKLLPIRDQFNNFKNIVRVPLPDDLTSAIETVSIAVQGEEKLDQSISIGFDKNFIRCDGKSKRGKIKKVVALENPLKLEPFSIEASPIQLLEVINKSTHLMVGESQAVFKSLEKKGFQHLIGITKT